MESWLDPAEMAPPLRHGLPPAGLERFSPWLNGVNSKSGRYCFSLPLLAVFLNCPSDFVVSNWGGAGVKERNSGPA